MPFPRVRWPGALASLAGTFRVTWGETGSTLKRAWIALWATGAVLLALGVWGDNSGFWADKPYLTNTFSALTGAAFGVPLALAVLQRLAASEADAAEARAAHRMARRVAADLASAVASLVKDGDPGLQAVSAFLKEQRDSLVPDGDYWRPATAPKLRYQPFVESIADVTERIDSLFGPQVAHHRAEVSAQWSILTVEARSRLLSTGGDWLRGSEVQELHTLVAAITGPALESWRGRGLALRERYREEDQRPGGISMHYGELDTLRHFGEWLSDIENLIEAVRDLAVKTDLLARAFAATGR